MVEIPDPKPGRAKRRREHVQHRALPPRYDSKKIRRSSSPGLAVGLKTLFGKRAARQTTPELRQRIRAHSTGRPPTRSASRHHRPAHLSRPVIAGTWDLAARVLDVGCGKGRFARVFNERQPEAELWGLDISEEMLRYVPAGIHTKAGSMTELPFDTGFFDGAYATESLEHAVEIEKAVAEIYRVLKPGGRIAIIDKNAEQWGRLETPEWEKWFTRKELELLLRRHCRTVSSRFISYWEDVEPDGLFLAGLAVKKPVRDDEGPPQNFGKTAKVIRS
jgi:SAM-dependent methyltransferase